VGPNGGASFGAGGGAYTALRIAQTLANVQGAVVGLAALWGSSPDLLSKAHGVELPLQRIRPFFLIESTHPREPPINALASPYFGAVALNIMGLLKRTIDKFKPDLIVFNDDSPRLVKGLPDEIGTLVYAHFPYACRLRYRIPEFQGSDSLLRKISDALVRPFMEKLFETQSTQVNWLTANSSITKRYMVPTFGKEVSVIYSPTEPIPTPSSKSNLIISIGAIQPNKRYADIIEGMEKVNADCKCFIFGHLRDSNYYKSLLRLIRSRGLETRIKIIPDAPRNVVWSFLKQSKVLVHAAKFEPFGSSVVEGMTAGAVPVVYAGKDSGPWVDIVKEGKFGIGFRDHAEMAAEIENLIRDTARWKDYSNVARNRAGFFSPQRFSERLLNLIHET
jgi:glycosyltransferase involved in cell wall biosynthesis